MQFKNTKSAAEAAAESAKKAIAAAQAAAHLANKDCNHSTQPSLLNEIAKTSNNGHCDHQSKPPERIYGSERFDGSNEENSPFHNEGQQRGLYRRRSYNDASDIKFDESDFDEEIEVDDCPPPSRFSLPPQRPPPIVPSVAPEKQNSFHQVHPKLPDYEDLAARFEALKCRKS